MNITIRKYRKLDFQDWDLFVKNANNGTIFHLRTFLSYHIDRIFNDHSLIFEKKGKIIAVFPAAINHNNCENVLYSHPGASFGGFVYNNISFEEGNILLETLENYCRKNNVKKIFFVNTPLIYHNQLDETLEYLLLLNNYKMNEYYISSVIEIKKNLETVNYLHSRKKRYIKNYLVKSSLNIEWENNFDTFYPILLENKRKHNVYPTHSLDELKKINNLHPNSLHLLLLYNENIIIGGTLNFIINNKCGMIFYNMIDYDYINLQPATIQIFESINWAKKYKLDYLDLGVSQLPKAKDPLSPHKKLINFKEKLGAKSIIRKAFQKIIT